MVMDTSGDFIIASRCMKCRTRHLKENGFWIVLAISVIVMWLIFDAMSGWKLGS
jgi:hypothetical protein